MNAAGSCDIIALARMPVPHHSSCILIFFLPRQHQQRIVNLHHHSRFTPQTLYRFNGPNTSLLGFRDLQSQMHISKSHQLLMMWWLPPPRSAFLATDKSNISSICFAPLVYGGASKVPRAVAVSVIFSNHQVDGGFLRSVFTCQLVCLCTFQRRVGRVQRQSKPVLTLVVILISWRELSY